MRASEWKAWLDSLPASPAQLQEVSADLARQVVVTEAQLQAALWLDDRRQARLARIRLTELHSQLWAIQTRLQVA